MRMIDIGKKSVSSREAIAEAKISLKPEVVLAINKDRVPKGDVLEAAKLAGILAAKRTADLLPLCHPIPIAYVEIDFSLGKSQIMM